LDSLANHIEHLPDNFVSNLLKVRLAMAPTYTALAVANAPDGVNALLESRSDLNQSPQLFAQFDWSLQHGLTVLSENPVFVLILNGFEDLFLTLAPVYFQIPEAQKHSLIYYQELVEAAKQHDPDRAKALTEEIMQESLKFWEQTHFSNHKITEETL
jgi:GntR family negative regulator for fad regulon and positive regulator of fabA